MAKILLIETATEVCSVGIAIDGEPVSLVEDSGLPNHAAGLTLLIQECVRRAGLTLADMDAVAVSRGPGSYTSLRVGVAVAKGICYALDKPLIAVDTLLALATASFSRNTSSNVLALPMLDARRKEVWTAVFDNNLRELLPAQPLILEHELFQNFLKNVSGLSPENMLVISGNGSKKMMNEHIFENAVFSPIQSCSATYLAPIAERLFQNADFQDTAYFEPFYMKPPNITISKRQPF